MTSLRALSLSLLHICFYFHTHDVILASAAETVTNTSTTTSSSSSSAINDSEASSSPPLLDDLQRMTREELEEICTSRGYALVQDVLDGEEVAYSHQDYVSAAYECLQLVDEAADA